MGDLSEYRRKRNASKTPEPVPTDAVLPHGDDDTFVIQEHHARALHWDVRLERDGVLVSWAVPKGLPNEPGTIHMAVHTEDHPLEYATFSGEIPKGEYGAGTMKIWDRGTYETIKWSDREVNVVLRGERVDGEFFFIKTRDGWIVRRHGTAARPDWKPLPDNVKPMLATAGALPPVEVDEQWSYEFKWDGVRALAFVDGGRIRLVSRQGNDITGGYPELRGLGEELGSTQVLLDGEIVALEKGRPSFAVLQQRMHVRSESQVRRLAAAHPVTYLIFDLLHLDGRPCLDLPYSARRSLLDKLELRGNHWQTPRAYPGAGAAVLAASRAQGLEGAVAKRLESRYLAGRRSTDWIKITDVRPQEVVIGGWRPGEGRREGVMGSLLLGVPDGKKLRYVGAVGTGFTDAMLERLTDQLKPLARKTSPFHEVPPDRARHANWVRPALVGEVVFREWTPDDRMRAPVWRGLRPDKEPEEVRLVE
ncbi:bifunctional non-homologous end joining protein LigD [Herbihabitans rhizosphaerae]|uniref:DNA ligase (ATP) n=1 Tax=Herbihabitans rhizosphaerae TaxID=1872711 RepID=A0A4Q7L4V1_9PSEU|nr:non-homologous end-joining DNA ligase [Herbihabitans rhizosphaerae]RZS43810.1 bifunctional non-homologous end joining protein LigD [Herbihabitans rhizosphaerae]